MFIGTAQQLPPGNTNCMLPKAAALHLMYKDTRDAANAAIKQTELENCCLGKSNHWDMKPLALRTQSQEKQFFVPLVKSSTRDIGDGFSEKAAHKPQTLTVHLSPSVC